MSKRWTRCNPDKDERQNEYHQSDRHEKRIVTPVITSDQNLNEEKRTQDHRQGQVDHGAGRSVRRDIAKPGDHEVSDQAEQRYEEIAANPMSGN